MTAVTTKTKTARTTKRLTSAAKPNGSHLGREWTDEQRARIAEIAYLRFLARDGQGGDETQDWLEAEAEYAKTLAGTKEKKRPARQAVAV